MSEQKHYLLIFFLVFCHNNAHTQHRSALGKPCNAGAMDTNMYTEIYNRHIKKFVDQYLSWQTNATVECRHRFKSRRVVILFLIKFRRWSSHLICNIRWAAYELSAFESPVDTLFEEFQVTAQRKYFRRETTPQTIGSRKEICF